jgi:hypothetical protein
VLDKLKGAAAKASAMAGDLQGMAVEKLRQTSQELSESLPLLGAVGYSVGRICIEVGISPKIMVSLIKVRDVADDAFDALLKTHAERKMLPVIVGALRQANVLQAKIKFRDHLFREIEIELGIPPAIRMVFLESTVSVALVTPASVPQIVLTPGPVPTASSPAAAVVVPAALMVPPAAPSEPAAPTAPPAAEQPATPAEEIATAPTVVQKPPEPELVPVAASEPPAPLPDLKPVAPASLSAPAQEPPPAAAQTSPPPDQEAAAPSTTPESIVRFVCPHCQVRYRVSVARIGEVLTCRRCEKEITIPSTSTK